MDPSDEAAQEPDQLIRTDDGMRYWGGVSADNAGMLGGVPNVGGFRDISRIDLQGSRTFLARLGVGTKTGRCPVTTAVDCGAG
jgi:protein N-terminal methyltransferase